MLTLILASALWPLGCTAPDDTDETGDTEVPADVPTLFDDEAFAARLQSLEALADANGGDRLSGSAGERAALDWARAELEDLGWTVEEPTFQWGVPLRTWSNLVATSPFGTDDAIVMMGAHVDTVLGAPGINDNGTGVAGVIGIAEALTWREAPPDRQVRLVLFTIEEHGYLGSYAFLHDLPEADRDAIVAYVNVDMIGSPNGVPFVLDGDGSRSDEVGLAPGSQIIEGLLGDGFEDQSLFYEMAAYEVNSDFGVFSDFGIPIGAVQSGAGHKKTKDEAELYGGIAGQPYDECYHTPCDRFDVVHQALALSLARAAAHAVEVLADGQAL